MKLAGLTFSSSQFYLDHLLWFSLASRFMSVVNWVKLCVRVRHTYKHMSSNAMMGLGPTGEGDIGILLGHWASKSPGELFSQMRM